MGSGEYVSVSTQHDTEQAAILKEAQQIKANYYSEIDSLALIYQNKSLSTELAYQVATALMAKDPVDAHVEAALNIDPAHCSNPHSASGSSMLSFSVGALLPILSITFFPEQFKIAGTFFVVLIALALTGYISATLGSAKKNSTIIRNLAVGMLTMVAICSIIKQETDARQSLPIRPLSVFLWP